MNLSQATWWLMVVGSINWGLSAFGLNLVNMIVGSVPMLEMIVYVLVGLSGVYALLKKYQVI